MRFARIKEDKYVPRKLADLVPRNHIVPGQPMLEIHLDLF
jgi:hypothetical protein